MNNASRKAVVITGASSGIGRASVSRMVEEGWKVFATVRKAEDGERLRSEVGAEITPVIMDVTDRASINAAAGQVAREAPSGLDGLVNVAGIGMARPIEYVAAEDLHEIFEINVFGQLAVIQAFLLSFVRRTDGS